MTKEIEDSNPSRVGERQPHRVRLPGFVADEEIGLGDVIKRAASYVGAQSCAGCERRRVALNHWMTFGSRRTGKGTV
jgi:hypothetical protein